MWLLNSMDERFCVSAIEVPLSSHDEMFCRAAAAAKILHLLIFIACLNIAATPSFIHLAGQASRGCCMLLLDIIYIF